VNKIKLLAIKQLLAQEKNNKNNVTNSNTHTQSIQVNNKVKTTPNKYVNPLNLKK